MEQEKHCDTIIIMKNPSFHGSFKLFVCKTSDKIIYEERLLKQAKVWHLTEPVIHAYILCNNATTLRDTIYTKFSDQYYSIVNDWISVNMTALDDYLKALEKYDRENISLSIIEKIEKARRRRRALAGNDSD
jgi:hypothetical protein